MSIQLSSSAAERVADFLARQPGAVGLRLGVRRTGCSGWGYNIDLTDTIGSEDQVFESHGIKVVVDSEALELLDGTEIDFISEGVNQNFAFRNPNATAECGCGESFTTREDAA